MSYPQIFIRKSAWIRITIKRLRALRWWLKPTFGHEVSVLRRLATQGYRPAVVYDVGASNGAWSETISAVLKSAEFHLFEPLVEAVPFYKRDFETRLKRMRRFHLHQIALSDVPGTTEFFVTHDGWGSSMLDRGEIPEVAKRVLVPAFPLDDYRERHKLPSPEVLKIDSQGAERIILDGAQRVLESVDVLFLETWLTRGYGPRTPLLGELIEYLTVRKMTLVDLGEKFVDARKRLYSIDACFFSERLIDRIT